MVPSSDIVDNLQETRLTLVSAWIACFKKRVYCLYVVVILKVNKLDSNFPKTYDLMYHMEQFIYNLIFLYCRCLFIYYFFYMALYWWLSTEGAYIITLPGQHYNVFINTKILKTITSVNLLPFQFYQIHKIDSLLSVSSRYVHVLLMSAVDRTQFLSCNAFWP